MYERLSKLCDKNGISMTKLCTLVTGSNGNLNTWKKGYMRSDYLAKCADILNVTTDYILGREEFVKTTPEKWSAILENMSNAELLQYLNVISYLLQERQHSQEA